FRVQFTTNTITWDYSPGDPSPINIIVNNLQNTTLNGDFSIASYVNVSAQSFTVTNVTLVTGSNYQVVFIDPANTTIVYATSGTFSVDAPGSKSISSSFAFLNGGGDATRTPDAQHVYPAGFSKCSVGTRFEPRPAIHGIKSLYRAQCDLTHLLLASPAPSVSPSGSGSASGSASASGSGASHSGASASGSGSGASTTNTQNAAVPALGVSAGGVVGVIAACGIASLSALLL
ncbi:hypothetical protein FOMPIDRAFT_1123394, partial [Fomitopsis schrenkii]